MTQNKEKKISEEQIQKAYQNVFGTDTGKLVYNDLCYRCFKYTTTAGLTHRDQILINEGRRQVLLHIESKLKPENKGETDVLR